MGSAMTLSRAEKNSAVRVKEQWVADASIEATDCATMSCITGIPVDFEILHIESITASAGRSQYFASVSALTGVHVVMMTIAPDTN